MNAKDLPYSVFPSLDLIRGRVREDDLVHVHVQQCSLKRDVHALAYLVSTGMLSFAVMIDILINNFVQATKKFPFFGDWYWYRRASTAIIGMMAKGLISFDLQ